MVRFTLAVAVMLLGCSAGGGASLERAPNRGSDVASAAGASGAVAEATGGAAGESDGVSAGAAEEEEEGGGAAAGAGTGGSAMGGGGAGSPLGGTGGAAQAGGGQGGNVPISGSGGAAGLGGAAGGPSSDGRSDDCQRAGWTFQCPAPPVDYPICHCIVSVTTCWGTSPTSSEVEHCWAYSITRQSVAIHGVPAGLLCELNADTINCGAADAALSKACGCAGLSD